jgi:hypothetical protein
VPAASTAGGQHGRWYNADMRTVLMWLVLASCTSAPEGKKLQLLVNEPPVELTAPTTVIVELFVVGAVGDVTITSPNLPSFATIADQALTLVPVYEDMGDYAIELVATSGSETANATLRLHILGANTGPMWLPVPYFSSGNGDKAPYAQMRAPVCDKEHDNFTFQIAIAPVGQPVANTPDFTYFIDFTQRTPIPNEAGWCADFITELPGLASGTYHGAVHAVDVHGAEDPYGWVELGGQFTVTNTP